MSSCEKFCWLTLMMATVFIDSSSTRSLQVSYSTSGSSQQERAGASSKLSTSEDDQHRSVPCRLSAVRRQWPSKIVRCYLEPAPPGVRRGGGGDDGEPSSSVLHLQLAISPVAGKSPSSPSSANGGSVILIKTDDDADVETAAAAAETRRRGVDTFQRRNAGGDFREAWLGSYAAGMALDTFSRMLKDGEPDDDIPPYRPPSKNPVNFIGRR